jgi:hypothetical protein
MKPGIYTSEFWIMVATKLIALAALFGVIAPGQVTGATDAAGKAIAAAFVVAGVVAMAIQYIRIRGALKALDMQPSPAAAPLPPTPLDH